MKCGPGLMAAVGGVLLLSAGVQADERTRHFPAAKCRYTLPTDEWSWSAPTAGPTAFEAAGPDGIEVALQILEAPPSARLDQKFADGVDRSCFIPGKLEKRGGRFITFLGLPCYEVEGRASNGRTIVGRVFIANGYGYSLMVIGNEQPVKQSPEIEAIMNGFAFDTPPTAPSPGPSPDTTHHFAGRMGEIGGAILIFAGVIAFLNWITSLGRGNRPTRSNRPPRSSNY